MLTNAEIGQNARSIRQARHLSLADVEALSDGAVKVVTLSALERGLRRISVTWAGQLAAIYEVRPTAILLGTPDTAGTR